MMTRWEKEKARFRAEVEAIATELLQTGRAENEGEAILKAERAVVQKRKDMADA